MKGGIAIWICLPYFGQNCISSQTNANSVKISVNLLHLKHQPSPLNTTLKLKPYFFPVHHIGPGKIVYL